MTTGWRMVRRKSKPYDLAQKTMFYCAEKQSDKHRVSGGPRRSCGPIGSLSEEDCAARPHHLMQHHIHAREEFQKSRKNRLLFHLVHILGKKETGF